MTHRQKLVELKYHLCKILSESDDEDGAQLTARVFDTMIDLVDCLVMRELVTEKEIL